MRERKKTELCGIRSSDLCNLHIITNIERKHGMCDVTYWYLSNQRFPTTSNWRHEYSVYVLRSCHQRSLVSKTIHVACRSCSILFQQLY